MELLWGMCGEISGKGAWHSAVSDLLHFYSICRGGDIFRSCMDDVRFIQFLYGISESDVSLDTEKRCDTERGKGKN